MVRFFYLYSYSIFKLKWKRNIGAIYYFICAFLNIYFTVWFFFFKRSHAAILWTENWTQLDFFVISRRVLIKSQKSENKSKITIYYINNNFLSKLNSSLEKMFLYYIFDVLLQVLHFYVGGFDILLMTTYTTLTS